MMELRRPALQMRFGSRKVPRKLVKDHRTNPVRKVTQVLVGRHVGYRQLGWEQAKGLQCHAPLQCVSQD